MSTKSSAEQITETTSSTDRDPLSGIDSGDIVVGPGGQTLAQAAAAESEPVTFAIRCACDIATGAAEDSDAVGIRIKGAWRDLNARGNGTETYRRALSPGGAWRFVSSERLPHGTFLAADRGAVVRGDVYVGDLIADYDRSLRGGRSQGEAAHDGKIGLVIGPAASKPGAEIEWLDVVRQRGGKWRVILPTGAHLTIPAAGWR